MDLDFGGRTVIVTGAAGGIGAATAAAFAGRGATVVHSDLRRPDAGDDGAIWVTGDLRDSRTVAEVVAAAVRTGRVDTVVNAAGVQVRQAAVELEEAEWGRLLGVNLSAAYALCRAAAGALQATGGSVVNIGSLSATHVLPGIVPYGATKAALTQLSKGLAVELGPVGVRVNAVAPGHIVTPMTAQNLARAEVSGRLLPRVPLGRFGAPDEVAETVLFLASDHARYVTGAVLAVDGGYSAT